MKKNFPLIAGISIPLLLIVFIACSIYIPSLFAKPAYNFLYTNGTSYGTPYSVVNGAIQKNPVPTSTAPAYAPPYPVGYPQPQGENQLFLYDITSNKSQPISLEDAQKLSLDPSDESPDGFKVVSGNSGGGFPFFGGSNDYNTRYLMGHNVSKKLNISSNSNYYQNFQFLGWVNK